MSSANCTSMRNILGSCGLWENILINIYNQLLQMPKTSKPSHNSTKNHQQSEVSSLSSARSHHSGKTYQIRKTREKYQAKNEESAREVADQTNVLVNICRVCHKCSLAKPEGEKKQANSHPNSKCPHNDFHFADHCLKFEDSIVRRIKYQKREIVDINYLKQ